jgi:hypothetical protein
MKSELGWVEGLPSPEAVKSHESDHPRPDGIRLGRINVDRLGENNAFSSDSVRTDDRSYGEWICHHYDSQLQPYVGIVCLKEVGGEVMMALGFTAWAPLASTTWAHKCRYFPVGQNGLPLESVEALRKALALTLLPLEALHMSAGNELAPSVKAQIAESVEIGRKALFSDENCAAVMGEQARIKTLESENTVLRTAVRLMGESLQDHDWANLLSPDTDIALLDSEISILVGLANTAKNVRTVEREAACQAICEHCAAGLPVIQHEAGYIPNYGDRPGSYIHYPVENSNSGFLECTASPIRMAADKRRPIDRSPGADEREGSSAQ